MKRILDTIIFILKGYLPGFLNSMSSDVRKGVMFSLFVWGTIITSIAIGGLLILATLVKVLWSVL